MATDTDEVYSTLNDLIETCQDGEQGFRAAADGTRNQKTREIFLEYARERSRFAGELQMLITEMGGRARKAGSMAGVLHRGWMNLKEAVANNNEAAIIAEVERGEDAAVEAYRKALARDLPPDVQEVVDRQYRDVLATHERIRSMEVRAQGGRAPARGFDEY
jgi:uncharacterized protein (TIGR02284 family)